SFMLRGQADHQRPEHSQGFLRATQNWLASCIGSQICNLLLVWLKHGALLIQKHLVWHSSDLRAYAKLSLYLTHDPLKCPLPSRILQFELVHVELPCLSHCRIHDSVASFAKRG